MQTDPIGEYGELEIKQDYKTLQGGNWVVYILTGREPSFFPFEAHRGKLN